MENSGRRESRKAQGYRPKAIRKSARGSLWKKRRVGKRPRGRLGPPRKSRSLTSPSAPFLAVPGVIRPVRGRAQLRNGTHQRGVQGPGQPSPRHRAHHASDTSQPYSIRSSQGSFIKLLVKAVTRSER